LVGNVVGFSEGFVLGKSVGLDVGSEDPLKRYTERGQLTNTSTLSISNLGAGQYTLGHPLGISRLSRIARIESTGDGPAENPTKWSYR